MCHNKMETLFKEQKQTLPTVTVRTYTHMFFQSFNFRHIIQLL